MNEKNPFDPALSLSDIIPGDFKPYVPEFEYDKEQSKIAPKSLDVIEELARLEAQACRKFVLYSECLTDPQLKETAAAAIISHKKHFNKLQDYLGSCR
ncbi:MAG: hypothetical protein BWY11_01904 [Firmicutes bacterium ADurb.Bin182]|nr:MAG: hypothetical protein BWY11_01904 [Firmicutes bacterium ADurb.Bin182]